MIYLLHGEDMARARTKAHEMIESLQKKKPDASFFKIDLENWNLASFEEYIGGQGLFSNRYIVFIDSVFQNKEIKEVMLDKLDSIKESENIFIFLEGVLDKSSIEKINKKAEKSQIFSFASPQKVTREFNIFSLGDALGKRDKKSAWVLFIKAKRAGLEDEQIHGTFFWSVKNMIVAKESDTAREAGLSPFVFSKAKSHTRNFEKDDLKKIAGDLVSLYHNSRRGALELDAALERFVLSL